MIDMTKKDILPCVSRQIHELSDTLIAKKNAIAGIDTSYETIVITKLSNLSKIAFDVVRQLEENSKIVKTIDESDAASFYYKNNIIPLMETLRNAVDEMETLCPSDKWCYPSYGDLLFSVK